jgi:hypothetical protein
MLASRQAPLLLDGQCFAIDEVYLPFSNFLWIVVQNHAVVTKLSSKRHRNDKKMGGNGLADSIVWKVLWKVPNMRLGEQGDTGKRKMDHA